MKWIGKAIIVVILLCSLVMPAQAAIRGKGGKRIKVAAEPILDNILKGFEFDDYYTYARDFHPSLKVLGSKTKFFKISRYIQRSLGRCLEKEYLGSLTRGDVIVVLWKGVFDKTKNDVLIKVELSKKSRRYLVTGLWLQ